METAAPAAPAAPAPNVQSGSDEGGGSYGESQDDKPELKPPVEQRYHKVKVNGKERTITEAEMVRNYSKALAADERLAQASKMEQSARAFMEALQNDPEKVLSDPRLSIDRKKLAYDWMKKQISEELDEPTDPRDIKLRDVEGKLKKFEEAENQKKQSEEQRQRDAFVNQRREAIAADLTKALEVSVFAKDPSVKAEVLREMATYLRVCRQQGYDVTPQEIADHIQSTHFNRYAALADAHDGESLSKLLGEKVVKKLVEHEIKRLRESRNGAQAPDVAESWQPAGRTKREFIDPDDLRRRR